MREDDVLYWVNRIRDGDIQGTLRFKPMTALVKLVVDLHGELEKVDHLMDSLDGRPDATVAEVATYAADLVDIRFMVLEEIERRSSSARP